MKKNRICCAKLLSPNVIILFSENFPLHKLKNKGKETKNKTQIYKENRKTYQQIKLCQSTQWEKTFIWTYWV